jgi:hypothetical protein
MPWNPDERTSEKVLDSTHTTDVRRASKWPDWSSANDISYHSALKKPGSRCHDQRS